MLVIRFFRVGKKKQPSFKIVVTDKRKPPRSGRFVEEVGFYNSLTKEKILKEERIKYWLSKGAKPSPTVYNLLVSEKIIEGKKIDVHKKAKKEEKPKEEKLVEEVPAPAPAVASAGKEEKPKAEKPKEIEEKKEETPPVEKPTEESSKKEEKEEKIE